MFFFDLFHPKLRPPGGHREASGAAREAPNAPLRRAQRPPEIPNRTRMLPNTSRAHPRWIPGATGKNVFFRPKIRPPGGAWPPLRRGPRAGSRLRAAAEAREKRNFHISTEKTCWRKHQIFAPRIRCGNKKWGPPYRIKTPETCFSRTNGRTNNNGRQKPPGPTYTEKNRCFSRVPGPAPAFRYCVALFCDQNENYSDAASILSSN